MKKTIRDNARAITAFTSFSKCLIQEGGTQVLFRFAGGAEYLVPTAYVLQWFASPHYRSLRGRTLGPYEGPDMDLAGSRVERLRRVMEGGALRLHLDTGFAVDVAWDTVLMACEPRYEHFGGLTKQARALTKKGFARWGPFSGHD